jgi:hypothetical protein
MGMLFKRQLDTNYCSQQKSKSQEERYGTPSQSFRSNFRTIGPLCIATAVVRASPLTEGATGGAISTGGSARGPERRHLSGCAQQQQAMCFHI